MSISPSGRTFCPAPRIRACSASAESSCAWVMRPRRTASWPTGGTTRFSPGLGSVKRHLTHGSFARSTYGTAFGMGSFGSAGEPLEPSSIYSTSLLACDSFLDAGLEALLVVLVRRGGPPGGRFRLHQDENGLLLFALLDHDARVLSGRPAAQP